MNPCPFCHSSDIQADIDQHKRTFMVCASCGAVITFTDES